MLAAVEERTLDELTRGHLELYPKLTEDLESLPPKVFFAPQGDHWSPAEHVDHLIRSVVPMTAALGWPRFMLRLLFGSGRSSRGTNRLVGQYLGRLQRGVRARGRYRPDITDLTSPPSQQEKYLARCKGLGDDLASVLDRWREESLDRYRLPHPVLGRLTIREMLAWSLYHGRHHQARILERLTSPPEPTVDNSGQGVGP